MANRKDVAEKAKVSMTVVSRVMNNTGYVSGEKREAVLKAAEALNYRPSPVARSLKRGQTRQILFYRGDLSNTYYIELHRGMIDYAEKMGYLVYISGNLPIERIGSLMMDGIILPSEAYARPEYLGYLRKYRMPYVVIGYGDYIPKNVYSVTVDTGLAMGEIMAYLKGKGHRRIAFANGHGYNNNLVESRYAAFRAMMEPVYKTRLEQYILSTPETIREANDDLYRIGSMAADLFVERKLDATAVVSFDDDVAAGFYHRIHRLGRRIPEDISVASFDGLASGEYMSPPLTSMGLNPFEHGKKCVEVIVAMLQGKKPGYRHRIGFSLVERESVRTLGQTEKINNRRASI
ncbi:MAG: LacI family transcriptional regulator [Treponema sp.]|nr:LacI family transcriptional regulator [Treponema sp.]